MTLYYTTIRVSTAKCHSHTSPPEEGGLRSGAVQDPIYPTVWWSALPTNCSSLSTDGFGEVWHATASATWTQSDSGDEPTARGSDIWMFPSGHVTLSH